MGAHDEAKYHQFKTTEDFILDKEFSTWINHPDSERDLFWNSFISNHPEKTEQIRDAALIIKALQPIQPEVSQQRLHDIFQHIHQPVRRRKLFLVDHPEICSRNLNDNRGWQFNLVFDGTKKTSFRLQRPPKPFQKVKSSWPTARQKNLIQNKQPSAKQLRVI